MLCCSLGVNIILWATCAQASPSHLRGQPAYALALSRRFLILHAASANFGFFFAMRFLLGVFESCVSPILLTYIAAMYPKRQQAKRSVCLAVPR